MGEVEKRQDPRLRLRVPVRCEGGAVASYRTLGFTSNVSKSGLLLEVPQVIAQGATTHLRMLTRTRIAYAEAVVVWTSEASPGRMGLQFTKMSRADAFAWEELLAFQGGPTPRSSVRIPIDLEVTCLVPPNTRLRGKVENLSDGGLLVILPQAVPPRTRVSVAGPPWLVLPPVEAEVVWTRDGVQQESALHGLRVIANETGKELFTIGAILRSFFG
ncbi:MAG TPA: PilZ domain-containing protein [Candidatus Methylomirabilis sp.]|nr:PilZ domain-containing protein [Candidatus Methylomirabilis sp.]